MAEQSDSSDNMWVRFPPEEICTVWRIIGLYRYSGMKERSNNENYECKKC